MAQNRRDVLSSLKTILEGISGIETVVRSYISQVHVDVPTEGLDISLYSSSDLPLIEVMDPDEETYQELTSHRAMMQLFVKLRVWFVDWNIDVQSAYETIMKNIRDGIGDEFKVDNKAVECRVDNISAPSGSLPVRNFQMDLELRYYLNEKNT